MNCRHAQSHYAAVLLQPRIKRQPVDHKFDSKPLSYYTTRVDAVRAGHSNGLIEIAPLHGLAGPVSVTKSGTGAVAGAAFSNTQ